MTKKRNHVDSHAHPSTSEEPIFNKRSRKNDNDDDVQSSAQSRIDPTYGQRGAFPGLDDGPTNVEDGLFYGPANDGLEYLRMVR